jgi:sarcosine oxidase, subunit beta
VIVHLPRPPRSAVPCFVDYTPGQGRLGLYLLPEGEARLVCGLHSEEPLDPPADPDRYPRGNDVDFLEAVAALLTDRLVDGAEARLGEGWSGLYPVPAGGAPLIGPHPAAERVICACGLGGSGLQSAPAVGRVVADWVLYGEPRAIPAAVVYRPTGGQS